jgi:hypothetical protein
MHHDAFNSINNQRNAIHNSKSGGDLVTKADMARRVNQIDQITLVRRAL